MPQSQIPSSSGLNKDQTAAIKNILFNCGGISAKDRTLVLSDVSTRDIADAFVLLARQSGIAEIRQLEVPDLGRHGAEPPPAIADAMAASTLILSLCRYSLAHSEARLNAATKGARFLSLPLYDWALLKDPCTRTNFRAQSGTVRSFADAFTAGKQLHVTSDAGTDVKIDINGRTGNYCPGFVESPGDLGSPPDIEANVSPIETGANGVIVIDGSITCPEMGLLTTPVRLNVTNGKIDRIQSDRADYVEFLEKLMGPADSLRRVLAECGVGLNPDARLTGTMLTDEGALGCMHFGFGANHTVGGMNKVDFHLDFVFRDPSLSIDGKLYIDRGSLSL